MATLPDGAGPVVIFDGVCNLCSRAVQFILDHDRRRTLLLAPSQGDAGRALLAAFAPARGADQTLFLVEKGRLHDRSGAVLRIARALGFPWSLAFVLLAVPRPARDAAYDLVARRRYRWFGRREHCRVARPGEEARFLA